MKFNDRVKLNRKDDFLDGEEAIVIDSWDTGREIVCTIVFVTHHGYHYEKQYPAKNLEKIDENTK